MKFEELLQEKKAEGKEEGFEEGTAKERDNMFLLLEKMSEDGKTDSIPRLAKEPGFFQDMLKQYQI